MSSVARFALVGYGGAGRGIHARLIREAGHVVTAVVARDPQRRAAAAADWPGVALHETLASLLDNPDAYDVIVVASPSGHHVEHANAIIDAGLPFVIDKPLAPTSKEAAEIVARAGAEGVPFTVFQNRRWDPEQLTLRHLLETRALGSVHTFERRWERWRPVPLQRWKENDPIAGGLLLDLGTHLVDSAIQLFGPVETVYAELRSLLTPTEDDVFITLHHADGGGFERTVSRLSAGSLVGAPGPRTRVLGTRAAYLVTSFEGEASPFAVLDEAAADDTEGWLVRGDERTPVRRAPGGHADFYRAVDTWLRGAGPIPVDPADTVVTATILDAARLSAREGRLVAV